MPLLTRFCRAAGLMALAAFFALIPMALGLALPFAERSAGSPQTAEK